MGLERFALVHFGNQSDLAKVSYESDHIRIGKPFSLTLDATMVRRLTVARAALQFSLDAGLLTIETGDETQALAQRLSNPKTTLAKLGIKPGIRVVLADWNDTVFQTECEEAGALVVQATLKNIALPPPAALIFVEANAVGELAIFDMVAESNGTAALWIISNKGRRLTLRDTEIMAVADRHGYVSSKVVGFDETRTALRFVRRRT